MTGHTCRTCGLEMPSPGGLAVHEMRHLSEAAAPPRPTAPPQPAHRGGHDRKAAKERAAKERAVKEPKAPKSRGRHKDDAGEAEFEDEGPKRRRRATGGHFGHAAAGSIDKGAPEPEEAPRRMPRRPSRAMSSGGLAGYDALVSSAPAAPSPPPHGSRRKARRARRKLDSTIPLTAFLVLASLGGGIVAMLNHQPTALDLAGGRKVLAADLSTPALEPLDPTVRDAAAAACRPVVEAMGAPSFTGSVDLAGLMGNGTFPALPLAGYEKPAIDGPATYGSVAEYLSAVPVIEPEAWQTKLSSSGFRGAARMTFSKGTEAWRADALRFASAAGAVDFNRSTLAAVCAAGRMGNAQPLPEVAGGITYVSTEGGAPSYRARIVLGDSVAQLSVCDCLGAPDRQALVGAWARAVAGQVSAV